MMRSVEVVRGAVVDHRGKQMEEKDAGWKGGQQQHHQGLGGMVNQTEAFKTVRVTAQDEMRGQGMGSGEGRVGVVTYPMPRNDILASRAKRQYEAALQVLENYYVKQQKIEESKQSILNHYNTWQKIPASKQPIENHYSTPEQIWIATRTIENYYNTLKLLKAANRCIENDYNTRQKIAAATQNIENQFKSQMQSLQEQKERGWRYSRM